MLEWSRGSCWISVRRYAANHPAYSCRSCRLDAVVNVIEQGVHFRFLPSDQFGDARAALSGSATVEIIPHVHSIIVLPALTRMSV